MLMDQQEMMMVVTTHMVDVEESSIDNTYHNYKHNPQPNHEDGVTNSFEKLAPKSCRLQSAQLFGCQETIATLES